jgi:C4-dicarboxylate transporter DctM subunit
MHAGPGLADSDHHRILEKEIRLEKIFKGIIPFLIAVIIGVVILILFPKIVLFLPQLMY